jgi:hypothetical protein
MTMTTAARYVKERREHTSANPVLIGVVTRLLKNDPAADDSEVPPPDYLGLLRSVERRVRGSKAAWYLRRYGGVYRQLGQLDDGGIAKTLGVLWLLWLVATFLSMVVLGPVTLILAVLFGAALLALSVVTGLWWFSYRRTGQQLRHQLLARDGFARGREIVEGVGAMRLVDSAPIVRPTFSSAVDRLGRSDALLAQSQGSLTTATVHPALARTLKQMGHNGVLDTIDGGWSCPATDSTQADRPPVLPHDVGLLLGHSYGEEVWAGLERPMYVLGPPRTGKGANLVIPIILQAPGAVISTSTRTDNLVWTSACRARRGPVELFNLEGLYDLPHTIRWSPLEGCILPRIAMKRAKLLVGASGLGGDNAVWATSSGGIVMALLYAAVISGGTIADVYRWSRSPDACEEPMRILETRSRLPQFTSAEGDVVDWETTIRYVRGDEVRMRANKWFGVENAFTPLMDPAVRRRLSVALTDQDGNPAPGTFNTEEFLRQGGTCYMLSLGTNSAAETTGTVGTFYSLFLDHVTDVAHELSQVSAGKRLDPPLTLVLDELANIHPWPGAARMATAGSGEGIQLMVVFHSRSQAQSAYGREVEETMWDASMNVFLSNVKSPDLLSAMAQVLGQEDKVSTESSYSMSAPFQTQFQNRVQQQPTISGEELRRLPVGHSVVLDMGVRAILVDLIPYWEGPHADDITASIKWHAEHPGKVITSTLEAVRR